MWLFNAENLARLHKSLRGKAKDAVQALLTVPDNVPDVIRSLERRFGRTDAIVQSLIDKAQQLPAIGEGHLEPSVDLANMEYGGDHGIWWRP